MKLNGRIAWITGSSRRLGRAIALDLAARGADIVVHCRNSLEDARKTQEEIEGLGRRSLLVKGDLSQTGTVQKCVDRIREHFGALHILVNNAANFIRTEWPDVDEKIWNESLDTNLKAPAFCALKAAPLIRESGGGHILNIADWAGLRPYRHYLPYMVSKGGIITLTRILALELAPEIHVNAIAPGTVLEPEDMPEDERRSIERNIPLKRIGKPEDITNTVGFFLESGNFITGQILCVDGGRLVANAPRI
jgi:pteridine reductase